MAAVTVEPTRIEGIYGGLDLWKQGIHFAHSPKAGAVNPKDYEGTRRLPDGRIIEGWLQFGWIYVFYVWLNMEAWNNYKGGPWDRYDPERF